MSVRLDFLNGIKPELSSWYYEITNKMYKDRPKYYPDLVEMVPKSAFVGGFTKETSAIGAQELQDLTDGGQIYEDKPMEGYSVYGTLKSKALKVKCPRTLNRDWHRTVSWIKDYVAKNWVGAFEVTKEKLVADMFNYGGYTAGHSIFNNDDSGIGLTTYTSPNLCYDGKPFINLSGNNRAAKGHSTTYYNGLALAGVTLDNAKTMVNLLTATNNKMENGNPFDNGQNPIVLCHNTLGMDWRIINESTLNPDHANNDKNPLQGAFKKIIANPYITTPTFSAIISQGKGLKAYFSQPYFKFWEINDPETLWASITMDYAIWVQNWRPVVANNAPVA